MLGIEQKKGNDNHLCGRMIAYAKINPSPETEGHGTPFDDLIKNGIFALEGDFRKEPPSPSRRAINQAVDDKINNMLESMEEEGVELPENMDIEALKDRLHELSSMEIIPIPARVGKFDSEEQILSEDADIYFIGEFIGMNQAHFCLTTLPIFYQARYREQAKAEEIALLNEMLAQYESGSLMDNEDIQKETEEILPSGATLNTFVGDLNNLLNSRIIPFLLACETESDYKKQSAIFYDFMKNYPEQRDIRLIDGAIQQLRKDSSDKFARQILELGTKKILAIYNEDIKSAEEINKAIANFSIKAS